MIRDRIPVGCSGLCQKFPGTEAVGTGAIQKINLSGRERVLDIGCGDGTVTAAIAECLPEGSVLGIDRSPDMIRFAREEFPPDEYPNLSFAKGDAQALGFSGEFDLVFSNAALHWVYHHGPVLAGIARALASGGRMIVQMGGKGNAAQIYDALDTLLAEPGWGRYFRGFSFRYGFFSPEEYRPWLETAGLSSRSVSSSSKKRWYTRPVTGSAAGSVRPGSRTWSGSRRPGGVNLSRPLPIGSFVLRSVV